MRFSPAKIICGDAGHTLAPDRLAGRVHAVDHDEHCRLQILKHHVVSHGHATADLDVDHLVCIRLIAHRALRMLGDQPG